MCRKFFRGQRRLTQDYSNVSHDLLKIVATINPHYRLTIADYWGLTECELLLMLDEFDAYNDKVKREMKDAKQVTMKNGKPAMKGVCPVCGAGMYRIGKPQ